jgi:replicative DNA helicase
MAKRLGVPTLLLCQLNRIRDESDPPSLHNLRDSGAIEQDADVVAFLHRDREIDPDTKEPSKEASFIVAKNRQGGIANTKLHFEGGFYIDPNEAFANDFRFPGGAS